MKGTIQFSKKALGCASDEEWKALSKPEKDKRFRLAWAKFKRRYYEPDGVDFIIVQEPVDDESKASPSRR